MHVNLALPTQLLSPPRETPRTQGPRTGQWRMCTHSGQQASLSLALGAKFQLCPQHTRFIMMDRKQDNGNKKCHLEKGRRRAASGGPLAVPYPLPVGRTGTPCPAVVLRGAGGPQLRPGVTSFCNSGWRLYGFSMLHGASLEMQFPGLWPACWVLVSINQFWSSRLLTARPRPGPWP